MNQSSPIYFSYSKDKHTLIALNKEVFEARHRLSRLSFLINEDQRPLYKKLCSYQLQLEQCKVELTTPYIPIGGEYDSLNTLFRIWHADRIAAIVRRQERLQQLVDIGTELLAGDGPFLEKEFRRLETELHPEILFSTDLDFYLQTCGFEAMMEIKEAVAQKIRENLKDLRARVKLYIKKISIIFIPDLRQRFRSIMRFLFKNLDDCSDEHQAKASCIALVFIKNKNSNEKYKITHSNSSRVMRCQ